MYKSFWVQIILTILFGPLGLIYTSVKASIILSLLLIIFLPAFGAGLVFWPISIFMGAWTVHLYNKKL